MKRIILALISLLLIFYIAAGQESHPQPKTLEIGSQAPDFKLKGVDDKTYSLSDFARSKVLVIVFSCKSLPYCPGIPGPAQYYLQPVHTKRCIARCDLIKQYEIPQLMGTGLVGPG